jgi:hypothetical protein
MRLVFGPRLRLLPRPHTFCLPAWRRLGRTRLPSQPQGWRLSLPSGTVCGSVLWLPAGDVAEGEPKTPAACGLITLTAFLLSRKLLPAALDI